MRALNYNRKRLSLQLYSAGIIAAASSFFLAESSLLTNAPTADAATIGNLQNFTAFAYLITKIRSSIFVLCSICLMVSVQSWSNDAGLAPAPWAAGEALLTAAAEVP